MTIIYDAEKARKRKEEEDLRVEELNKADKKKAKILCPLSITSALLTIIAAGLTIFCCTCLFELNIIFVSICLLSTVLFGLAFMWTYSTCEDCSEPWPLSYSHDAEYYIITSEKKIINQELNCDKEYLQPYALILTLENEKHEVSTERFPLSKKIFRTDITEDLVDIENSIWYAPYQA